jgi:ribonuclease BN (tRNA processing enzyme)
VIGLILITHFHLDHFGGIPFFILDAQLVAKRARPLIIAGPPGLNDWFNRLFALQQKLGVTMVYVVTNRALVFLTIREFLFYGG